jgi:hypothetical protein
MVQDIFIKVIQISALVFLKNDYEEKKQWQPTCYIQVYRRYEPFNYGKQSLEGFIIEKVEQQNCVLAFVF